jgi:hypothetical protein
VIPDYKVPYSDEGIYGDFTYGTPGVSRGFANALGITQGNAFRFDGPMKILVIGAGSGYEIAVFRSRGHQCFGIDLHVPDVPFMKEYSVKGDASQMPFAEDEFDLVFCGETLEHIPEDVCLEILSEVKRIGKNFYFTIATRDDGKYKMHINVHPAWWWMKTFEECGLVCIHSEDCPFVPILYAGHGLLKLRYRDGVTLYGNCNIEESEVSEDIRGWGSSAVERDYGGAGEAQV